MSKIVNYIIWPAIAGLVFAIALLQLPRLTVWFPFLVPSYSTPAVDNPQNSFNLSFSDAVAKAAPAVVSINSQQDIFSPVDFLDRLQNPQQDDTASFLNESNNLGSGVIISPDGYIITSYHIFFAPDPEMSTLNATSTVTLHDGRNVEARLVVLDEASDLALLKIDANSLSWVEPAAAPILDVGDIVLAIGNPRNIGQSASMGIISAILSTDDGYVIQTDAAINPGYSGGALIDVEGNLIGINSTIISESGGSEGIGFATPASKASDLLHAYIESGPGGYLGVEIRVTDALTASQGLRRFGLPVQGLLIDSVDEDSPAERAGIMSGDIIVGVNGEEFGLQELNDVSEAISKISSYGPDEEITLNVFRNPDFLAIPVVLGVGEPIMSFTLEP